MKTLNLKKNLIRAGGATSLANLLTINNTLTDVSLSQNTIADKGMDQIANSLKVNKGRCRMSPQIVRFAETPQSHAEIIGRIECVFVEQRFVEQIRQSPFGEWRHLTIATFGRTC